MPEDIEGAVAEPAVETTAASIEIPGGTPEAKAPAETLTVDANAEIARLNRELSKKTEALKRIQAKQYPKTPESSANTPREPEKVAPKTETTPQDNPLAHPALRGLRTVQDDETGETMVIKNGVRLPIEFVIADYDEKSSLRSTLDEMKAALDSRAANETAAQRKAEYEQAAADVYKATEATIIAKLNQSLPALDPKAKARIERDVLNDCIPLFDARIDSIDQLTEAIVDEVAGIAIKDRMEALKALGVAQIKTNQQVADISKVKPDGSSGTPAGKSLWGSLNDKEAWKAASAGLQTDK